MFRKRKKMLNLLLKRLNPNQMIFNPIKMIERRKIFLKLKSKNKKTALHLFNRL